MVHIALFPVNCNSQVSFLEYFVMLNILIYYISYILFLFANGGTFALTKWFLGLWLVLNALKGLEVNTLRPSVSEYKICKFFFMTKLECFNKGWEVIVKDIPILQGLTNVLRSSILYSLTLLNSFSISLVGYALSSSQLDKFCKWFSNSSLREQILLMRRSL